MTLRWLLQNSTISSCSWRELHAAMARLYCPSGSITSHEKRSTRPASIARYTCGIVQPASG